MEELKGGHWVNIDAKGAKSVEEIFEEIKLVCEKYDVDKVPLESLHNSLFQ